MGLLGDLNVPTEVAEKEPPQLPGLIGQVK